jgi:hypothetical protein
MYISLPEMLINGLLTLERKFLNAFKKNYANLVVQIFCSLLYPFWCYLFIVLLDLGARGSALSNLTGVCLNYSLTIFAGYIQKDMAETWFLPSREVIRPESIKAQFKIGGW